jgi:hypothetical protein
MQMKEDGLGGVRPTDGDRLLDTSQGDRFYDGNTAREFIRVLFILVFIFFLLVYWICHGGASQGYCLCIQ